MKMDSHTINTNGLKMDKDKHKIRNNKATKPKQNKNRKSSATLDQAMI